MADLTTQILIEIRDEIRSTRVDLSSRIDETNARLDQANARLDRVERRQVEAEVRVGTEITSLLGVMRDVGDALRNDRSLRDVVVDHERRLTTLESRG